MPGPGVHVTTAVSSGPKTPADNNIGQWFVVGITERGDSTNPVRLTGMADYVALFGNRVSYGALYDALKLFFDEGGEAAWVRRIAGPAATTGSLILKDGSGANTLRITANAVGAWSANMSIVIAAGYLPNTFALTIYINGLPVESYSNLASPSAAVAAMARSSYVTVTDLGSTTVAPGNNPAVLTATPLSAGTDDRASITASSYVTALDSFKSDFGAGAVSVPGQGGAVYDGVIAHCQKVKCRIAIFSTTRGATVPQLITAAIQSPSEFAGVFTPWVQVSDGGTGTRTISPEGYVAACRARAIKRTGVWQAPAGALAVSRSIIGLDQTFSGSESSLLDDNGVNVIRQIANTFRLYGWRSTSLDINNWQYLNSRDLINQVVVYCKEQLEQFVFQPVDGKGHLLSNMNEALVGVLDPIAQAGGLYPRLDADNQQIDPGYSVDTSSSVNSIADLASNKVSAVVSVRPSPTAALVELYIYKTGLQVAL